MWFDFKCVIVLIFYLDEVVSETDNFTCEVEEIVYSDAHNFIGMECVF